MIDNNLIIGLFSSSALLLGVLGGAYISARAASKANNAKAEKDNTEKDISIAKLNMDALISERARVLFLEKKLAEKDAVIEMKDKAIIDGVSEVALLTKRVSELENILNRILVLHPELRQP